MSIAPAARLALLVVAGLALLACGGQVEPDLEQARSLAATGELLASEAAAGRLTAPYVRTHSEALADSAADLARRVRSDEGDWGRRDKAEALAGAVRDAMRELGDHPADHRAAAAVAEQLKAAAG